MLVESMQEYYRLRACEYDASMGYDNESVIKTLDSIIEQVKVLCKDQKVLELACGPGFWTSQISQTARFVSATDFNQSTIDQAIQKGLRSDKVSFCQADAYNLKSIEGEFDILIAIDWLAHVPLAMINMFLQGVNHRLRKGSQVVFIDQLPGPNSLTGELDEQGNHIQKRVLGNSDVFDVIKHYFSNDEYEELFNENFVNLSIKQYPECRRVLVSATVST